MRDIELAVIRAVESYQPDSGAICDVLAGQFSEEEVREAITSLLAQSMLSLQPQRKIGLTPSGRAAMSEDEPKVYRLTFDLTEEAFREFEDLQMSWGLPSRAATLRYALRMFQWVREETLKGGQLCIKHGEALRKVDLSASGLDITG